MADDHHPCSSSSRAREGEGGAPRRSHTDPSSSSSSSPLAFLFGTRAAGATTGPAWTAHSPAEGSAPGPAPAAAGEAPPGAPPPPSSSSSPAPPPPPPQQQNQPLADDDIWESSKPVERRSQALTDELHDCLGLFWSWVTCGGPGARVRQLYVNGRLSRCADEWSRLRTCAAIRATGGGGGGGDGSGGGMEVTINPGPHPVWRIRSRKEAGRFWADNYAHLGAGAVGGAEKEGGAAAAAAAGKEAEEAKGE